MIDIAKENKAGYVVYHSSMSLKNRIDHKVGRIIPLKQIASEQEASEIFTERALKLHRYAQDNNVQLLLETTPLYDLSEWFSQKGRLNRLFIGKLPMSVVEKLTRAGIAVANDFEHTACNYPDHNHNETFDYLYKKTQELAAQTRLLHLGYLIPPYNGTDYHGSLSNPEFETDKALPNKQEMIRLFKLFKNHKQLWIIPEPQTDHIGSYKIASNLLNSAGFCYY